MTCARCGKTVTVQVPDGWIAYCSRACAYAAWDEDAEERRRQFLSMHLPSSKSIKEKVRNE